MRRPLPLVAVIVIVTVIVGTTRQKLVPLESWAGSPPPKSTKTAHLPNPTTPLLTLVEGGV